MPGSAKWQSAPTIPIFFWSDAGRNHRSVGPDHFDGQGMDAALQFGVERFHDGAMLLQAGLASECSTRNSDAIMCLSTRSRTGVTLVSVALVNHFKMVWSEFLGKFLNNRVANGHMDTGSGVF